MNRHQIQLCGMNQRFIPVLLINLILFFFLLLLLHLLFFIFVSIWYSLVLVPFVLFTLCQLLFITQLKCKTVNEHGPTRVHTTCVPCIRNTLWGNNQWIWYNSRLISLLLLFFLVLEMVFPQKEIPNNIRHKINLIGL